VSQRGHPPAGPAPRRVADLRHLRPATSVIPDGTQASNWRMSAGGTHTVVTQAAGSRLSARQEGGGDGTDCPGPSTQWRAAGQAGALLYPAQHGTAHRTRARADAGAAGDVRVRTWAAERVRKA